MTNVIHAPANVPAAAKRGPRTVAVPEGVTVSRAAAATLASERIAATLTAAKSASGNVIVKTWGADTTPAALRLAKRAADEISGAAKSRGGARADVLATVAGLPAGDDVTPAAFVAAALSVLKSNADAVRQRRERKQALADLVNDASASLTQRSHALDVLAGMDDADAAAKGAKARQALAAATLAFILTGGTQRDALTVWNDAKRAAAKISADAKTAAK